MTAEEELIHLRHENRVLQEQVSVQQETISVQSELITRQQEQITLLERELGLQQEQLTQFAEQVQALHERLAKDSHNSHLPPSSDRFSRQPKSVRKKSGKKPGGQQGHPGKTLLFSSNPDEVMVHPVERCEQCQADLRHIPPSMVERRQVVDVPPTRLLIREHHSEQKQCPHCQQITIAAFPTEVRAPVQYGPRIAAIAVYLVQQQLLPLARTCEVMEDLLCVSLSQGTVCDMTLRCASNLTEVEQHIKEALISSEVIHQDETGLYVTGQRQWLHVTCTPRLTYYAVHASRGRKALDAIGILPRFAGTSVHDGWRSYFLYACTHALCLVHLLRDLTFLAEEQGLQWAADLKALVLEMKEAADEAREHGLATLHPLEVQDWQAQFEALVTHADATTATAQAPPGTKGRAKQSAARNVLDRLIGNQEAVLAFLHRLVVPFDNNLAERDIRMVKVQQKISGSFRSAAGATAFCRIRGYLSTVRKQGFDLLASLEATLSGHPILPSFQST
jgi:transposase